MDIFKKLKEFYWPYKKYFFGSLFFGLIMTVITVIYPMVLQITIDAVIVAGSYHFIPYLAVGFIVIMMVKVLTHSPPPYLGDLLGITSIYHLINSLYTK